MIFSVQAIPLRFNFNSSFLGTYWSHLSDFHLNTDTGSRSILFQIFYRQIFSCELLAKKDQFSDFSEG